MLNPMFMLDDTSGLYSSSLPQDVSSRLFADHDRDGVHGWRSVSWHNRIVSHAEPFQSVYPKIVRDD